MQKIYQMIKEQKKPEDLKMATVLEGEHAGEKILFCKNEQIFAEDAGFLSAHRDAFLNREQTGLVEIENTRVFFESFMSVPKLVICGAGTVGQAIVKCAATLNFEIIVIEDRTEFLETAAVNGADRCICKPFEEAVRELDCDGPAYYVVVTRDHSYDKQCIKEILKKPHAYVGLMGSKRRTGLLKEDLLKDGFEQALVDSLHAPIGIDINADTPEEIAISILGEIIQIKNAVRRSEGCREDLLEMITTAEEPLVMASIVDKTGSTPRSTGTKMLIRADGSILGSIGGGVVEANVICKAVEMINSGEKTWLYLAEMTKGASLLCGGTQLIFLEVL